MLIDFMFYKIIRKEEKFEVVEKKSQKEGQWKFW